jgi:hypothetical protein
LNTERRVEIDFEARRALPIQPAALPQRRAADLPPFRYAERANLGVAQLDWISGFEISDSCGLQLQASITPCLRCIEQDGQGAVKRTIGSVTTAVNLGSLARLVPGTQYWLASGLNQIGILGQGQLIDQRHEQLVERDTFFDDDSSFVCTMTDLRSKRPALAGVISEFAWCPDSTAFFVSEHGYETTIIPTGEILRACYMPSIEHLVEFIEDGWDGVYETNRTSSRHSDVHFTGFAFECSPRKSYPYRVARNRSRAELEIRQLLPRAAVYGRSHPGSLPILIRPPFIGRVVIRGKAIVSRGVVYERLSTRVGPQPVMTAERR